MENQMSRFVRLAELMREHGIEMISALVILIVGLYLTKWVVKKLREGLEKYIKNDATVSITANSIGVLMLGLVVVSAGMEVGAKPGPLVALMMIIVLCIIGILVIFRPLVPTLPFKVGDTVKAGNLLGKVEATTVLNTRLRTFDGKTFFVPNRQILDDIVINYHFTKTRRVKIDVTIRYDQDLLRAKQALEAIMIGDARVLEKPNPQVYILDLGPNGVELGGRCWVNNAKYWMARSELLEKTKLRFDHEGIRIAYPQLDVNHRGTEKGLEQTDYSEEEANI